MEPGSNRGSIPLHDSNLPHSQPHVQNIHLRSQAQRHKGSKQNKYGKGLALQTLRHAEYTAHEALDAPLLLSVKHWPAFHCFMRYQHHAGVQQAARWLAKLTVDCWYVYMRDESKSVSYFMCEACNLTEFHSPKGTSLWARWAIFLRKLDVFILRTHRRYVLGYAKLLGRRSGPIPRPFPLVHFTVHRCPFRAARYGRANPNGVGSFHRHEDIQEKQVSLNSNLTQTSLQGCTHMPEDGGCWRSNEYDARRRDGEMQLTAAQLLERQVARTQRVHDRTMGNSSVTRVGTYAETGRGRISTRSGKDESVCATSPA